MHVIKNLALSSTRFNIKHTRCLQTLPLASRTTLMSHQLGANAENATTKCIICSDFSSFIVLKTCAFYGEIRNGIHPTKGIATAQKILLFFPPHISGLETSNH